MDPGWEAGVPVKEPELAFPVAHELEFATAGPIKIPKHASERRENHLWHGLDRTGPHLPLLSGLVLLEENSIQQLAAEGGERHAHLFAPNACLNEQSDRK